MGLPLNWVTAIPGLPYYVQIQAVGNGVVPAQAAAPLRRLFRDVLPGVRQSSDLAAPHQVNVDDRRGPGTPMPANATQVPRPRAERRPGTGQVAANPDSRRSRRRAA